MTRTTTTTKDRIYKHYSKILGLTQKWKQENKSIVFTNGCFDLLHVGHLDYLEKASKKGDKLIIGLNSDDSVRRLKGESRPLNSSEHRAYMLVSLIYVDAVVVFEEDTPLEIIKNIAPDVLIKGGDYEIEKIVGYQEVIQNGGKVETIDFVHDISSTKLWNKIKTL